MKKLALAVAATALTAMTFTATPPASAEGVRFSVGVGSPHRVHHRSHVRHVTIVRHDRGLHRGWYKKHAHAKKIFVVKHRRHG